MWRLVEGCGVSTILSLGGKDDASKVKVGMVMVIVVMVVVII
jgi:hypothetical protein